MRTPWPGDAVRIGVDACCWANARGYGRFTRELVRAMVDQAPGDDWLCFADERAAAVFDVRAPNVKLMNVRQTESPTRAASADGHRSPTDVLRLTRAVWGEGLDVFFSPSVYTYFPLPPRLPAVVAIHDAIPERFPELTLPSRRARLFWRAKVGFALRQARLVLTVSEYSALELGRMLGVDRSRIRVAQPAPSPAYGPASAPETVPAAARHGVPVGESWFTYVGGFNPHKRVESIVRAHAAVVREGRHSPHLLLAGSLSEDVFHGNVQQIRDAVTDEGTESLVHWLGFVPDDEMRLLHAGAVALVLASEAEGFGLPAIEAAACGTPVIATTASPLPAVLEGGGIFVRPGSAEDTAAAMRELLDDPAKRSGMGGRARSAAAALSWTAAGASALAALREAAGRERAS